MRRRGFSGSPLARSPSPPTRAPPPHPAPWPARSPQRPAHRGLLVEGAAALGLSTDASVFRERDPHCRRHTAAARRKQGGAPEPAGWFSASERPPGSGAPMTVTGVRRATVSPALGERCCLVADNRLPVLCPWSDPGGFPPVHPRIPLALLSPPLTAWEQRGPARGP